jgi:hypothetical protein
MARSAFSARILEIVKKFDDLPDDAVVPFSVFTAMGGPSERTFRRSPPIPKIQLTKKIGGGRVGDWRKLVRGGSPQAAA